jgi:hypothetical protein
MQRPRLSFYRSRAFIRVIGRVTTGHHGHRQRAIFMSDDIHDDLVPIGITQNQRRSPRHVAVL